MTVEDYINNFEGVVRDRLLMMRQLIQSEAPEAAESIAYGMPAYKLNGKPLVYFGGYPNHIGFYATPNAHEAFKDELRSFKQGKGSVQFPHSEPLPEDLIRRMVRFRVEDRNR